MGKYNVTFLVYTYESHMVEAASEEEAIEKAYGRSEYEAAELNVDEVEEL